MASGSASFANTKFLRPIALALFTSVASACSGDKVTSSATPTSTTDNTPPARPNIIFLLADDQRWDVTGSAGNQIIQTPNLDALARQGVSFRNAYVTTPVCAISRASIFTGEYASRHGILDFTTDFTPEQLTRTYPALLKAAGYTTGFIGKFGVGNNLPAQMFDYWRGFPGQGDYQTRDESGTPVHLTRLQSKQALEFLDAQPKNKPFVLSVSFKAPHVQDDVPEPFQPEANDMGMYSNVTIPAPATVLLAPSLPERESWRSSEPLSECHSSTVPCTSTVRASVTTLKYSEHVVGRHRFTPNSNVSLDGQN